MKTIRLKEVGHFVLSEEARPSGPGPGEALVRVHRVGMSGTDYQAFAGKQPFFTYPRIVGHELGVEVLAVAENDRGIKVGDRCAVEPFFNCEKCIACRRGKPNCCIDMKVLGVHLDGGMREAMLLPVRKLHVATGLQYEQIALVETLAIGAHAVERAGVEAGENILVIGAGPIGLAVIEFARKKGRVIVMDVSDSRLAFCRDRLGIHDLVDAHEDPVETVRYMTGGDMPTVVLDVTGSMQSMNGAMRFLGHSGRLVNVGRFQGDFTVNDAEFHRREAAILASRNALPGDFAKVIAMLKGGQVNTLPWITHRALAGEILRVFPGWATPESGVIKAMIEF